VQAACVCAFNDRRAVGAVFGVGFASIGILPTSATAYSATSMVSRRIIGIVSIHLLMWVLACVLLWTCVMACGVSCNGASLVCLHPLYPVS